MMKIAICDDVLGYISIMSDTIKKWEKIKGIRVELMTYSNGSNLLYDIEDRGAFDVILLDVELGGENGIEVAKQINMLRLQTLIIFVSQFNYFKDAYDAYPFHFLSKPIDEDKMLEVLDKALDHKEADKETFAFEYSRRAYTIRLCEVEYFFSEKRIIHVMMEDEEDYQFYGKLNDLEKELQARTISFIRVHKSYLVNTRHIKTYGATAVTMHSGVIISVSADRRAIVREAHMKALECN